VGIITPLDLRNFRTNVHRTFFAESGWNRGRSRTCPILNIFIRSEDIRRRTLKSFEIGPYFARF